MAVQVIKAKKQAAQVAASAPIIINFVFMFCLLVTLFVSCERLLRSQALYARRGQISRGKIRFFVYTIQILKSHN